MKLYASSLLVAGALLTSTALAADLPAPVLAPMLEPIVAAPVGFTWAGAYIGLNAGWGFSGGWAEDDVGIFRKGVGGAAGRHLGRAGTLEPNGGFVGAQAGFNFQSGMFVGGIEGDIQWSGIDDGFGRFEDNDDGLFDDDDDNRLGTRRVRGVDARVDVDWFGTVRGRAGVAFNRVMLYGTGGLAFGGIDYRVDVRGQTIRGDNDFDGDDDGEAFNERGDRDDVQLGYVVGGGAEFAVTDNFTVKGEYQYLNFGRDTVGSQNFRTEQTTDFHTVRIGANFKFSGLGF